jgi:hypothetical protein
MSNVTINQLPAANTIDPVNDLLPIFQKSSTSTLSISRNTLLGLASAPVGLTDSQTLTNKVLTSPTINGATLSGTLSGTYTIGGTPTFPSSVVTLTGSQTLTNKVLTSPTINSPSITNATLTTDTITGYTSSSTGSVFGISVTSGTIGSAALAANSVLNAAITTGNLYASKFYNPYKFNVYQNTAQTGLDTSIHKIVFDSKNFDTGTNFSTVTSLFTAPISGFYWFGARVKWASVSTAACTIYLYKNGSPITSISNVSEPNTGFPELQISDCLQLAANDTVGVYSSQASGTKSIQIDNNTTIGFSGFLVSAT